MKRLWVIFFAFMVFLCGCKAESSELSVAVAGYECSAEITYGDEFSASAVVSVPGGGILNVYLTSPEALKGMNFSATREGVRVSYNGIESEAYITENYGSFAQIMGEAFLKLSTGTPVAEKKGEDFLYENTAQNQTFSFMLNEDGFPKKFQVPSKNLTVEFCDWKYKQKN